MAGSRVWYRGLAGGGEMLMHTCAVCGSERAPFGLGVSLRKNKPGEWFCAEHFPGDFPKKTQPQQQKELDL
jgi:hypothetical protein